MKKSSRSAKDPTVDEAKRGSVDQATEPRFLAIGRVGKPHGVHGEVRVEPLTDHVERFGLLKTVYISEGSPRPVVVESVRYHKGFVLLKLAGFSTRNEAELLRDQLLLVPEAEAVPLEEGEYYLFQLEGIAVYTVEGLNLGRIREVIETGANNVFVVQGEDKQFLIPDIPDVIVEIDFDNERMTIDPLPGLIDDVVA